MEFRRHINKLDLAGVVFMAFIFGISLVSLLTGLADTALFTFLSGLTLAGLVWLILMPVTYCLEEKELLIRGPWPLRSRKIDYNSVLDIDAVGSYLSYKTDADAVEIMLTLKKGTGDKTGKISCHPTGARAFVRELDARCPHLVRLDAARPHNDLIEVLRGEKKEEQ